MRSFVPVFAFTAALAACTDTYHPEYHPVTVTHFSQNVGYPVVVNNGARAAEGSPVYIGPTGGAPPPAPAFAGQSPPTEPPPGFFEHP